MREMLFRSKRLDNGKWVEGYLLKECNYATCSWNLAIEYKTDRFGKFAYDVAEVDPETVGQYTGLTDKNGKKIFEGDIVEEYDIWGEFERLGTVSWNDLFCAWHIGKPKAMYNIPVASYVVIGNIHDNPELLEG